MTPGRRPLDEEAWVRDADLLAADLDDERTLGIEREARVAALLTLPRTAPEVSTALLGARPTIDRNESLRDRVIVSRGLAARKDRRDMADRRLHRHGVATDGIGWRWTAIDIGRIEAGELLLTPDDQGAEHEQNRPSRASHGDQ
jgi:hypothetical protein